MAAECVNHSATKAGEIVRCLPNKKFAWLSSCRYGADQAQNLPGPAPDNVLKSAPDFIQIGPLSAELWPNARTSPKRAVM